MVRPTENPIPVEEVPPRMGGEGSQIHPSPDGADPLAPPHHIEVIEGGGGVLTIEPDEDLSDPRFAIRPILPAGGVALVGGLPKAGKTSLGLYVAAEVLRGRDPIPGVFTLGTHPPTKVLVMTEMSAYQAKRMFIMLFDPMRELVDRIAFFDNKLSVSMLRPDHLRDTIVALVERDGYDLVLIDTLARWSMTSSGESLNDQTTGQRAMDVFRQAADLTGASHLVIAHNRKDSGDAVDLNNIAGSVALRASTDANTGLRLVDEESTVVEILTERRDPERLRYLAQRADALARDEDPPVTEHCLRSRWYLRLAIRNGRLVYREAEGDLVRRFIGQAGGAKHEREDIRQAILDALESLAVLEVEQAGEQGRVPVYVFRRDAVLAAVGIVWEDGDRGGESAPGRPTVEVALAALEQEGEVMRVEQGKYPDAGRRAGWGLRKYLPIVLGGDAREPAS